MESNAFFKRIDDLAARADRQGVVTHTAFLTPAEQTLLGQHLRGGRVLLFGGAEGCERRIAFFLPDWLEPEAFDPGEHVAAVHIEAHFGAPAHRDYLGAVLALGIRREAIGDLRIFGETAFVFCLPSVQQLLLDELHTVGRVGVKPAVAVLSAVPAPEIRVKTHTFTVKSLRLDAVAGAMFGMSRTAAAELIRMGAAKRNDLPCEHPDAPVREGDTISLRGHGKGRIKAVGDRSKKDRIFLETEVYL